MAITINSQPAAVDIDSIWDVTTSLTESASIQNLRIKCEIQNTAGSTTYAIVYQPKGLDDIDLTDLIYNFITFDIADLDDWVIQTPNNNSFFEYQVKFTEVYEDADGVAQTGANSTSSDKMIFKIEANAFADIEIVDGSLNAKFLTNNPQNIAFYQTLSKITDWTNYDSSFNAFISSGKDILFAEETGGFPGVAISNTFHKRKYAKMFVMFFCDYITGLGGANFTIALSDDSAYNGLVDNITIAQGFNFHIIDIIEGDSYVVRLNGSATVRFCLTNFILSFDVPSFNQIAILTTELSPSELILRVRPYNSAGTALDEFFFPKEDPFNGNDITGWTNDGSLPFTTLTTQDYVIEQAADTGNGQANTNDLGAIASGDTFYCLAILKRNSGSYPKLEIWKGDNSSTASGSETLAEGINQVSFVCDISHASSMLKVTASSACDFSLTVYMVRAEKAFADERAIYPLMPYLNMQTNYAKFDLAIFKSESVTDYDDDEDRESAIYAGVVYPNNKRDYVILEWLNNKGGFDTYRFLILTDTRAYDLLKYKDSEELNKTFDAIQEHSYNLTSENVDRRIALWLSEIMRSKTVYDVTSGERKEVSVNTSSLAVFDRNELKQVVFQIQYKDDY